MEKRRWQYWVLLFLLFFLREFGSSSAENTTCSSVDLRFLEGFVNGIDSGRIRGWINNGESYCCRWPGITCAEVGTRVRVVGLNLTGMDLHGSVSDSLGGLEKLRILDLSNNSLSGTFPASLFRLKLLEVLNLSLNDFSGEVDNPFLPSLRELNISLNHFNGTRHPLFAGAVNLTAFDASSNMFEGTVNATICDSSPKIEILRLSENLLSGAFPVGFGNCRALKVLRLDSNAIEGNIPVDLFGISTLEELHLQENSLAGEISPRIGNLSRLLSLDLSSNKFSGPIPDVFDGFANLETFSASSNQLSGGLPLTLSNVSSLRSLALRNNSLTGEISLDFKRMPKLTSIDLGSNMFTGVIPDDLSKCRELKSLNVAKNGLGGGIPESFRELKSLSSLSLSNNSFSNISSALRILQHCPSLSTVVFTRNSFHGETLSVQGIEGFKNLSLFVIANCGLVGPVPEWLSKCENLHLVDLSWNRLDGSIPPWFGNLNSLFYIDLANNSLSGQLPVELATMKSLLEDDRSSSSSSLPPPTDLPFFSRKNQSQRGLQYNQLNSFPPSLILNRNKLVGSIPPEFGKLKKLHVFDLSHNNMTGEIPGELSGMSSLEKLDLSYNNFTGSIPSSLNKLSFLSKFSVAYNDLSGPIPTGVQFSTFTKPSFVGNPGLCGGQSEYYPSCDETSEDVQSTNSRRMRKGAIVGMSLGVGLGTAIIAGTIYFFLSKAAHSGRVDDNTEYPSPSVGDPDADELLEYSAPSLVVLFKNKDGKDITVNDILKATNNFDQGNIIGCGGFGLVYKATFADGRKVAIKRLSGNLGQMDKEFHAEVETLSRAEHQNLVMLQGFCRIGSVRILIYSYMENGSLDSWLHEKEDCTTPFGWSTRLRIARGAARGLEYLHHFCQPHILHRDIKSSNILLDGDFQAHLADFGLARLIGDPYDTHVSTDLVGTLGYIPPEYGQASVATFKGDIYSFGVVLLELLTGRRPMDVCQPKGRRELMSWVAQMQEQATVTLVFDPAIHDRSSEKEMLQVLDVACRCIRENPKDRPTIQEIVLSLDEVGTQYE